MDALLEEVRTAYAAAVAERDDLRRRFAAATEELETYREIERELRGVLAMARASASRAQDEAVEEGRRVVEEARREAETIAATAAAERVALQTEVERLRQVRAELVAGVRALVLAGLELLGDARPEAPTNADALAVAAERDADAPAALTHG